MKLLVTGGRDFTDEVGLWLALSRIHAVRRVTLLIHGDADGTDTLAKLWAAANGVPDLPFPITAVDWAFLGRRAGNRRNQQMLDEARPDLVLATMGHSGTHDMVTRAKAAGIPGLRLTAPGLMTMR